MAVNSRKQTTGSIHAQAERSDKPAAIEYAGIAGISKDCQDAVLRFIQFGDRITHSRILSSSRDHCLLLTINLGDVVAVKSGFASGYGGEGPRRFSYVLQVLESHGADIDEVAPQAHRQPSRQSGD
jgi:hypothetical protein